jgi:hypothetical protein
MVAARPGLGPAYQPVSFEGEARFSEPGLPAGARAKGGRLCQQAVLLLLAGEFGKRFAQRVVRVEEGLLGVQDRGVGALAVVGAVELARAQPPAQFLTDSRTGGSLPEKTVKGSGEGPAGAFALTGAHGDGQAAATGARYRVSLAVSEVIASRSAGAMATS